MNFIKNLVVDKIEDKVQLDLDGDGDIGGKPIKKDSPPSSSSGGKPSSYLAAASQSVGDDEAHPPSHAPSGSTHSSATRTDTTPSSAELSSLDKAVQALWDLDRHRLTPGDHYAVSLQQNKHSVGNTSDHAHENLFSRVDVGFLNAIPTYKHFISLLDNYERSTGQSEVVTQEETDENNAFLNAVLDTPVGQYLANYLQEKGHVSGGRTETRQFLYRLWFYLYRRETHRDSSGFEHVFVGEERDGKISGFHNWLQFFLEEKAGKVNYKGYFIPRKRGRQPDDDLDGDEHLLSVQFDWEGEGKSVSTMFVGTSPEYELALYTICFLEGREENRLYIGGYDLTIKCFKIAGNKIGTCFPML